MRFLIFDAGKPTAVRVNMDAIAAYHVDPSGSGKTIVLVGHEDTEITVIETPEEIDAAIENGVGIITPVRVAH